MTATVKTDRPREKIYRRGVMFPKAGANGYFSHNFSKWFGRYLKQVEIKTTKTTFHSFRHNFKDRLRNAGIEDSRQNALMGHSDGSVPSIYGSEQSLKILNDDIQKINSEIDFNGLYKSN